MKTLTTIILMSFLFLFGCFGDMVKSDVQQGMTKNDLIDKLGHSDGYKSYGEYEVLSYVNKQITHTNMYGRADYSFIFKNDRLVEWGPGQVRQTVTSTGAIIFVPVTY